MYLLWTVLVTSVPSIPCWNGNYRFFVYKRYLLILKPDTKYWVHIEGTFVQSLDTLITIPKTNKSISIDQNFVVNWRQAPGTTSLGANAAQPAKKE